MVKQKSIFIKVMVSMYASSEKEIKSATEVTRATLDLVAFTILKKAGKDPDKLFHTLEPLTINHMTEWLNAKQLDDIIKNVQRAKGEFEDYEPEEKGDYRTAHQYLDAAVIYLQECKEFALKHRTRIHFTIN